MNQIVAPLAPEARGPAVADLQDGLKLLVEHGVLLIDGRAPPEDLTTELAKERERQFYAGATRKLVGVFQERSRLKVTGAVDAPTANALNEAIAALAPKPAEFQYLVRGQIFYKKGLPIPGLLVKGFHRELRGDIELGEGTTDAVGNFEIYYNPSQNRRLAAVLDGRAADVFVRVTDPADKKGTVLLESPTRFGAARVVKFRLYVDGGPTKTWSEFEQLGEELKPHLGEIQAADLIEDEKYRDVSLLAGKLAQPKGRVAAYVAAHKLAAAVGGDPAVFYALVRKGLPSNLPDLLALPAATRSRALVSAIEDGIAPGRLVGHVEATRAAFADHAVRFATADKTVDGSASLGTILTAGVGDRAKVEALVKQMVGHTGPAKALWDKIGGDPALKESVPEAQLSLQLAALTGRHMPLIEKLLERRRAGKLASLRDFASYSEDDWLRLINAPGIAEADRTPPSIPGENPKQRARTYAATLTRIIADAMPTLVLAHRIQADAAQPADVRRFWKNVTDGAAGFELGRGPVGSYLKANPGLLAGVDDSEALTSHLNRTQRLFNLAPDYADQQALEGAGLTSSLMIARLGQAPFLQRMSTTGLAPQQAVIVYEKASRVAAAVLDLTSQYGPSFNSALPKVLSAAPVTKVPDLETLFGTFDLCACDECNSVHGAAAYFADLLAFLADRASTKAGRSARDVLFVRRPDLGEIELSCANTNRVLPATDLINELLERRIAPFAGFALPAGAIADLDAKTLSPAIAGAFDAHKIPLDKAARVVKGASGRWSITDGSTVYAIEKSGTTATVTGAWPQTGAKDASFAAVPEHVNEAAYEELASAIFPWSLPLHLPTEEVRLFLDHLQAPRHLLMSELHAGGAAAALDEPAVAVEYLGLSDPERQCITGTLAPSPKPWQFWGLEETGNTIRTFDAPTAKFVDATLGWVPALGWVSQILHRSGLDYATLVEVLGSSFVNPGASTRIVSADPADAATCDVAKLVLTNVKAPFLDRLSRFVRLWRKLGWSVGDLDLALTAIGGNSLDDAALVKLSHIGRLQAAFGGTVDQIVTLWSPLPATGVDSLYTRLFLNPDVLVPSDPGLALDSSGEVAILAAAPATAKISLHVPAVVAALRISAADLAALQASGVAGDDILSRSNLSALYRRATLARWLDLGVSELLELLALTGIDPFDRKATADTVRLIEIADAVVKSGLAVADLGYLLFHTNAATAPLALGSPGAGPVVDALRRQLRSIVEATRPRLDPAGDQLRRELAALKWPAGMIDDAITALGGAGTYTTAFASPPAGFAVPAAFADRLRHDPAAGTLTLTGSLTVAQRNALQAAFPDAGYQTAIADLFAQPRAGAATRMRAFTWPAVTASLAAWPAGLVLPAALRARTTYDPAMQRLGFDGTMTAADKAAMGALSSDPAWLAATASLLAAADAYAPPSANQFVTAAVADTLFELAQPADRFAAALALVLRRRRTTDGTQLVVRFLAEGLGLKASLTERLLTQDLPHPSIAGAKAIAAYLDDGFAASDPAVPPTDVLFPAVFELTVRLTKIAALVGAMRLSDRTLDWLARFAGTVKARPVSWGGGAVQAGWPGLADLPASVQPIAPARFAAWLRLAALARIGSLLPGGEATVDAVLAAAHAPGSTAASAAATLALLTGADKDELLALATAIGLTLPDDLGDETGLTRLCVAQRRTHHLNTNTAGAQAWAAPAPDAAASIAARRAVQSFYPADQWPDAIRPLEEVLRERRRAALVDYLVVRADAAKGESWTDSNGIYDHLLLDVETHPVVLTSRLKAAIGSVQLFVQRCLMNLEPEVVADADKDAGWSQWPWMKRFRVWEANRKIFLYPENWIEPELRDDKSAFFRDLETKLLQAEVTADSAEDAFAGYLEQLDEVARMEVAGLFHQPGEAGPDEYHVFARTHADPPRYFYRKWVGQARWTPWEPIDVDIPAGQIVPLIWNRRLYLFWPVFTHKVDAPAAGSDKPAPSTSYFELQLAWSEYRQGHWGPKKMTPPEVTLRSVIAPRDGVPDGGRDLHVFRATTNEAELRVWYESADTVAAQIDKYGALTGAINVVQTQGWLFSGCNGRVSIFSPSNVGVYPPPNTRARGMGYEELGRTAAPNPSNTGLFQEKIDPSLSDGTLQLPKGLTGTDAAAVLRQTPGAGLFKLMAPHQEPYLSGTLPFFFQDDQETLFVVPGSATVWMIGWTRPDVIAPSIIDAIDIRYYRPSVVPDPLGPIIDRYNPVPVIRDPIVAHTNPLPAQRDALASAGTLTAWRAPEPLVPLAASGALDQAVRLRKTQLTAAISDKQASLVALGDHKVTTISQFIDPARLFGRGVISFESLVVRRYLFRPHYHAYVCSMVKALNIAGSSNLLRRSVQLQQNKVFQARYDPSNLVEAGNLTTRDKYPIEDVDFTFDGAYAGYNWELFFHAPLMIASRLMQNQRFEDAQKWFHTIFDPTDVSGNPAPQRYWRTRPFFERQDYLAARIDQLLTALAKGETDEDTSRQLSEWIANPFNPFAVARLRTVAFQKTVVMKYLDNLLAWGDQLFRQDTIEAINEATQLYILAAEILGPRPATIAPRAAPETHTFNTLAPTFAAFADKLADIETVVTSQRVDAVLTSPDAPPLPVPQLLYFCVGPNDQLLGYWDKVADRLFKIRNSLNLAGVRRTLPLFEPPIDPMLLVKAAAAGIDLSSAIADLSAPAPLYRFPVLVAKAVELCNDVKSLGGALLQALERRDAEDLAHVQAVHEVALLTRVSDVKEQQIKEADAQINALLAAREVSAERYRHYMTLLGTSPAIPAEGTAPVDAEAVAGAATEVKDGVRMIPQEDFAFQMESDSADERATAAGADMIGNVLAAIPMFSGIVAPWGGGMSMSFGGSNLAAMAQASANMHRGMADISATAAQGGFRLADLIMRAHNWQLETNLAAREIVRVDKELATARIRLALATRDRDNHLKQIEEAKEVEEFLQTKYTRRELYDWMVGRLSTTYFQAYQLAYDAGRRAEQAFRRELAQPDTDFVRFGYWDSLRKGLLAGDALLLDLRRMEVAYLDGNAREYEITKHVSLASLHPEGLLALQERGACFVDLPEAIFDLDNPGHYLRRLRSVSVTIPCVAGPYTSVPCKLTLLANRTRVDPRVTPQYGLSGPEDHRFEFSTGGLVATVTSHARDDTGLFEPNLRDERYLPFEGAGAISAWRLELPAEFRSFDYRTIADVVLTIRYTAREGGDVLRAAATGTLAAALKTMAVDAVSTGLLRGLSARHEFTDAWAAFVYRPEAMPGNPTLALPLVPDRFPGFTAGRKLQVSRLVVALVLAPGLIYDENDPLTVNVTPPGGAAIALTLNIVSTRAGGLPMAQATLPAAVTVAAPKPGKDPVPWTIEVTHLPPALAATVAGVQVNRLDPEKIVDVVIICGFTV